MTATAAPPAAAPASEPMATVRRPQLDGLRAVAVYLVVIFHAGSLRFSGGFIGVDVFFVLSGYLVTQVLLRDLEGPTGRVRFGRFYARRVRRLLPASLIALTVSAFVYVAVATPSQIADATGAFKAAYLYVANWYFVHQSTDYFASDVGRSPVLHVWSLAVEEQFYVLWPLLLAGLVWATGRLGTHRRLGLRLAVAAGALASAGWALALRADRPERAYFGTDTRAYQLLAGALLALTPGLVARARRRRWAPLVGVPSGLLAVLVLSVALDGLDPIERGIAVTLATCVLIVALDAEAGGPIERLLSCAPVAYLGRISYGTYLWHWPVVLVIGELIEVDPKPLAAVVALIATGIASLSYQLVERPIRRSPALDRRAVPVVAVGLALSVVAALVVAPRALDRDAGSVPTAAPTPTAGLTPVPTRAELDAVYRARFGTTVDCVDRAPSACTVVRGSGPHLLLMGDSNAQMWIPALSEVARTHDLTLSLAVTPGCPWQRGLYVLNKEIRDQCRRNKEDAYTRVIPALRPDLVVVAGAPEQESEDADPGRSARIRRSTVETLQAFEADGTDVLIIESAPTPDVTGFNPLDCLAKAGSVEACRFVARPSPSWVEQLERDQADGSERVTTVDLDRLICPFLPICDTIVGGRVVFYNGEHLTESFSRSLAPQLATYLDGQGFLD